MGMDDPSGVGMMAPLAMADPSLAMPMPDALSLEQLL